MEVYIALVGLLIIMGITVGVFYYLMESRQNAFVFGSLSGLVLSIATAGVYWNHLSSW